MGRTVRPFNQVMQAEYERWKKFRRALRKEDQTFFDDLFEHARLHVQAGAYASHPIALESIFMAILIEQQKMIRGLELQLQELRIRLDGDDQ
ncbi:MAG: hypothetical protein HY314_06060 [Acidobacteria bacterium]|nr:hypothetical protein [Acidobacteriota bacterium]